MASIAVLASQHCAQPRSPPARAPRFKDVMGAIPALYKKGSGHQPLEDLLLRRLSLRISVEKICRAQGFTEVLRRAVLPLIGGSRI